MQQLNEYEQKFVDFVYSGVLPSDISLSSWYNENSSVFPEEPDYIFTIEYLSATVSYRCLDPIFCMNMQKTKIVILDGCLEDSIDIEKEINWVEFRKKQSKMDMKFPAFDTKSKECKTYHEVFASRSRNLIGVRKINNREIEE
jgi:hypothetical protein